MTEEEKHKAISQGVAKIGQLFGHCAKVGMDESDIVIMLQTSTSLLCEMNEIDISMYMKFLYVLHKRRVDRTYDPDEHSLNTELSQLFALKDTQP